MAAADLYHMQLVLWCNFTIGDEGQLYAQKWLSVILTLLRPVLCSVCSAMMKGVQWDMSKFGVSAGVPTRGPTQSRSPQI